MRLCIYVMIHVPVCAGLISKEGGCPKSYATWKRRSAELIEVINKIAPNPLQPAAH